MGNGDDDFQILDDVCVKYFAFVVFCDFLVFTELFLSNMCARIHVKIDYETQL